jgi:chitinase
MFGRLLALFLLQVAEAFAQQPVVITYAGGYNGNLINTGRIEAGNLTHLLYAFADVHNGEAFLNYPRTDGINLRKLVALRQRNPHLKVLLSVGGLGWSRNFSTMALTDNGRRKFARSCARLMRTFDLDGIDIDWEFPGYAGEGRNIFRPEDKQNYTLLFKALRSGLDSLSATTQKRYQLTAAVDGLAPHFLPHSEMDKVALYADYICLMTYNFNTKQLAGGHYLFAPNDWDPQATAYGAVTAFVNVGVPMQKLVLGAGFFPAAFQMETTDPKNRKYRSRPLFKGGLVKVNRMAGHDGFLVYRAAEDPAPYVFNTQRKMRIAYEDTASVKAKCTYIRQQGLAGIMYWDYFSDPGRKLLQVIRQSFK